MRVSRPDTHVTLLGLYTKPAYGSGVGCGGGGGCVGPAVGTRVGAGRVVGVRTMPSLVGGTVFVGGKVGGTRVNVGRGTV